MQVLVFASRPGICSPQLELGDKGTLACLDELVHSGDQRPEILSVRIFPISMIACIVIFIHVTHACRLLGFAQMSSDFCALARGPISLHI